MRRFRNRLRGLRDRWRSGTRHAGGGGAGVRAWLGARERMPTHGGCCRFRRFFLRLPAPSSARLSRFIGDRDPDLAIP